MENGNSINRYMDQVVRSIGVGKASEWTRKQLETSIGVRNDVVREIRDNFMKKESFDDAKIRDGFLDFCNAVRVLLIVYNYGDLDFAKLDANEAAKIKGVDLGSEEEDKRLILLGVMKILDFVRENGFSIAPYLKPEEMNGIFAVSEGEKKEEWPIIPITLSATSVFITLVYFRRAISRKNLFSEEDLIVDDKNDTKNYHLLMVETVTRILRRIYDFANGGDLVREGRFSGWGFTLDNSFSQTVTLSDTYAVVDAINRFSEAFDSDDKEKRDDVFLNEINQCNAEIYSDREDGESEYFVQKCISSIYKTAFNLYKRTQRVYGTGVFYEDAVKVDGQIRYNYYLTDYNQISSSIRSSALFNPLYVALITLYGYNDKEVVIGRFMDDPALVRKYYDEKTEGNVREELIAYAKELSGFERAEFEERVDQLIKNAPSSTKYGISYGWSELHATARVFQKFLEKKRPEELMKITEYQNYLNATKDAIDQVQVMYRNFYNGQRYGVVDTDYAVFSDLDIKTNDALNISRLNKASIGVNSLRPILFSAKILIVNALVKYPNAEISEMYQAIINSRYRPNQKRGVKRATESDQKWLWNEDLVDMNSTCRHCEVIMYDYFDYYDKYELGLKTLNLLKSKAVAGSDAIVNGEKEEQFVILSDGSFDKTPQADAFADLVLELTERNVGIVKEIYEKRVKALEDKYRQDKDKLAKEIDDLKKKIAEKQGKIEEIRSEKAAAITELKESVSYRMGDTLKQWIQSEMESTLVDMMAMLALKQINYGFGDFSTLNVGEDTLYDAGQQDVHDYLGRISKEYAEDEEETIKKYDAFAAKVTSYQELINMAMDGIFKMEKFDLMGMRKDSGKQDETRHERRNAEINLMYKRIKQALNKRKNEVADTAIESDEPTEGNDVSNH